MTKKTFGQAFAEARKLGLDKFLWKGGWYSTKRADETSANSHVTVESKNRKKVTKDGNTGYAAKSQKNGDLYMGNLAEVTVTAPRLKVDRKTSGFLPVDENKNYNDKQGNTRLYLERGTGRYLVTDNNNNIVGYSFDPAAATSNSDWGGWIAYTGSKNDLKAAGAGKLRDEANRNEINQKSKLAYDRKIDEREHQLAGLRRLQGGFNTVQSIANLPNHAIIGGLKMIGQNIMDGKWATENKRNERLLDYLKGFTVDGMWRGEQEIGLGDLVEAENPHVRFGLNFINPMSVISGVNGARNYKPTERFALGKINRKKGYTDYYDLENAAGKVVLGKRPNGTTVVEEAKFMPKGEEVHLTLRPLQTTAGTRYRKTGSRNSENIKRSDNQQRFMAHRVGVVQGTPFEMIPFNAAFRYDPKTTYTYSDETPTANFWYSGEGNPNTYALGRIATGEVVPGTSGKNWSGGQSGGRVSVDNTKGYQAPTFGGITIGTGKDNKSKMYMPLGYKRGGKLIPRKQ